MDFDLRNRARALIEGGYSIEEAMQDRDLPELLQELRIHQIELKLQNEELQKTQLALQEAQAKYFNYYQMAPVGYLVLDAQGIIRDANLTAIELLQKDDRPIVNRPMIVFLNGKYTGGFLEYLNRVMDEDYRGRFEAQVENQGLFIQFESTRRQRDGGFVSWVIISDISERVRAQQELQATRERLDLTLRGTGSALWAWDMKTGRLELSQEWYEALGYDRAALSIDHLTQMLEFVHPDDRAAVTSHLHRQASSPEPIMTLECRVLHHDGSWRWMHNRAKVMDWDGENVGRRLYGIQTDVTHQYLIRERDYKLQAERERIYLIAQFIKDASHEFRTPLSVILTSTQFLQMISDSDVVNAKVERISTEVRRIVRLVDMLLLMSELDSQQNLQDVSDIALAYLITHAVEDSRPEFERRNIHVEFNESTAVMAVRCNASYLKRAFSHIIENAVRYSKEGQKISIEVFEENDFITISITDEGMGISAEDLPHIYERLWRKDPARHDSGFGLGLSIAKSAIEIHGGHIDVFTQLSRGSTFRVNLPRTVSESGPV